MRPEIGKWRASNHLLDDEVLGLDAHHHICEKTRHVDSQGHVCDHFLDHISLSLRVLLHVHVLQQLQHYIGLSQSTKQEAKYLQP